MIYTRPDYYNEFQCLAGECPDTCCCGWQIEIDDESLEKYKKTQGNDLWKMMAYVDWESRCFRQDNQKNCAFLNQEHLCELQINMGEDGLCKTCRDYPRHTEVFEGVREVTLSASCPEVARILMERMTPVHFITDTHSEEEETEYFGDFDPFLYSVIEDARKSMLEILQNRQLTLKERTILVLGMGHDMQRRVNTRQLFACEQVIEKYKKESSLEYVREYLKKKQIEQEEKRTREMFPLIYELELLRNEWSDLLHKSQDILFFSEETGFAQMKQEFESWKTQNSEMEVHLEQILIYFLFTYFPASVYDGQLFAKVQMSVYCTWMIELLWMARWFSNGKKLEIEEMIEILYRFSREFEHSDENLETLDEIMIRKWFL